MDDNTNLQTATLRFLKYAMRDFWEQNETGEKLVMIWNAVQVVQFILVTNRNFVVVIAFNQMRFLLQVYAVAAIIFVANENRIWYNRRYKEDTLFIQF